MSYKVIRPFKDLSDSEKHEYKVGDSFPRKGYKPSESFIRGLLTGSNSAGSIFIMSSDEEKDSENEEVEELEDKPKRKRSTKKVEE